MYGFDQIGASIERHSMKYCPKCNTQYDEEILRFCMKDGTPLLNVEEPNFVEMPSESIDVAAEEDDPGEVTVIRRNIPVPPPDFDEEDYSQAAPSNPAQRIVVPTTHEPIPPHGRPPVVQHYQQPPRSNTAKVVILTMFGTIALLAIGALGFWFLQNDRNGNTNANANVNANLANADTNLNTNLNIEGNFNFNVGGNFNTNTNANANANVRTPTPTPRPSVTPSPSPTETPEDDDVLNPTPTRTPVPTPTPIIIRPGSPTPPSNRPTTNSGVLNGRAIILPTPAYPPLARQMRAAGQVAVQVSVDERGNVISARAVSGHPLLRQSAEAAARQSKISPARVDNRMVPSSGVLLYNFKNN